MGDQLKTDLYRKCLELINSRIETARNALQQARESANDETKSSAGDKFETSREMMQQEMDRNKRLLLDAEEQRHVLSLVIQGVSGNIAQHGSIIYTSQGNFYISVSAGQITVNGILFYAVSPSSPIGKLLMGKSATDRFELNGRQFTIKEVG